MILEPALYIGVLRHRRFRPRRHEFNYKLFMAWLDIDRIPELMAQSAFTSYNRFNWASFMQRDHFGDPLLSLRDRVMRSAVQHGVHLAEGPIFLLTHLRYLGYCFNPISFYYCYDCEGGLTAVLAEVNSTFGESHNYWLSPRNRRPSPNGLHYRCPKSMHVSPFMGMDLDYDFALTQPAEKLVAHMTTLAQINEPRLDETQLNEPRPLFDATLSLERRPWTPANLARVLLRHPWMTATVIAAIHWQALLLYLKRIPVFTHPGRLQPSQPEASKRL